MLIILNGQRKSALIVGESCDYICGGGIYSLDLPRRQARLLGRKKWEGGGMRRKDFIKLFGVLPAAFLVPDISSFGQKGYMAVWGAGYRGNDRSLRLGFFNELDEQFFIGYRKVRPDYTTWKEHFKKPIKKPIKKSTRKHQPKDYIEAARSDNLIKTLSADWKDNRKRYNLDKDDSDEWFEWAAHGDLSEYHQRMAEWCEKTAKILRKGSPK